MDFSSCFGPGFLETYQAGVMRYKWKGVGMLKSPIDMALYLMALQEFRPRTIFEIGSRFGGSALWLSDMSKVLGLDARIFSIDIEVPKISLPLDSGITFLQGDCAYLGVTLGDSLLAALPRPFFVIEDSSHCYSDVMSALEFWSSHLVGGELMVVEDGVLESLGLADKYGGGPNKAIDDFFHKSPASFAINRKYCDFYGENATYSPNGWLIKS